MVKGLSRVEASVQILSVCVPLHVSDVHRQQFKACYAFSFNSKDQLELET